MKFSKLNIGIVGLGEQAIDNLIPPLILSKYARLVSICDLDPYKLETIGDQYEIEEQNRHNSYKKMIENNSLDVVIISSFPEVHYQVAKFAIKKNIAVFVEKPPVQRLDQLMELISLTRRHKVKTGVGMNFSYTDADRVIKKILKNEDFGNISFISLEHISSKPTSPLWNLESTLESFLLAQLIHPLDYLMSYGGQLKSFDVFVSKQEIPFIIQILFEFENGTIGSLKSGSFYPKFRHEIEMISHGGNTIKVKNLNDIEITKKDLNTPFNVRSKNCHISYSMSPLKSGYSKAGYSEELNNFFESVIFDINYEHNFEGLLSVYECLKKIQLEIERKRSLSKKNISLQTESLKSSLNGSE